MRFCSLRKIGCRCVLDENRDVANLKPVELQCVESLSTDVDSDELIDFMSADVGTVGGRVQEVQGLTFRFV